jgi:hypothetical protein
MYDKRIKMPLPLPHTKHVAPFTALVGQESYESKLIVAGCYIIKGPNLVVSPVTNLISSECYIGNSTHLGHRVKTHTKGVDSTTREFIKSLVNKGMLELCILTSEIEIPAGLTKNQFITLLEQYLIIKLKPTVNKKLLATPGVMWTPEVVNKFLEKMSQPVYAYHKQDDGKMVMIQIFPSTRAVGMSLDLSKSFYSNLKIRTGGWYKDKIYFTDIKLDNTESNILSLHDLKELISVVDLGRTGFGVRVTDERGWNYLCFYGCCH